jgi:hypothetical protein
MHVCVHGGAAVSSHTSVLDGAVPALESAQTGMPAALLFTPVPPPPPVYTHTHTPAAHERLPLCRRHHPPHPHRAAHDRTSLGSASTT